MIEMLIGIFGISVPIIVVLISAVYGPDYLKKKQNVKDLKQLNLEGDASTEQMYIQNMTIVLGEYKEQVAGFKSDLMSVKNELLGVREDFADFRKQHEKKIVEYQDKINFLENEKEKTEDENEELRLTIIKRDKAIEEKDTLILELKGGA